MSGNTVLGIPLINPEDLEDDASRAPRYQAQSQEFSSPVAPAAPPRPAGPPSQGMFGAYTDPSMGSVGPAQGQLGAYYHQKPAQPVSKAAAVAATANPVAGAAMGLSPLTAAGLGVGASALIITTYIGVMGGLGYWLGGKLTPVGENDTTYKWGGAIGNVLLPGVGLGAVALIAMLKD